MVCLQCLVVEHNLLKKVCASNVKVKAVSVDCTEAYHGSEGITAPILNLDRRWRCYKHHDLAALPPLKEPSVPLV